MTDCATNKFSSYCIVPAAGRSSRMGAWKPLLPWGATTVCGAVIDTVLAARLCPVLVAGYRASDLLAAFAGRPGIRLVENAEWERGMLGSIRAGLSAIIADIDDSAGPAGFFVAPADMPRLPLAAFAAVAAEAGRRAAEGRPSAVFAASGERLGHPVWIPATLFGGLTALEPDSRLRDYLLVSSWTSVEVDDDGIFADLDTPEAYAASYDGAMRGTSKN